MGAGCGLRGYRRRVLGDCRNRIPLDPRGGAMSENAELSGKALPFVGLAEGICLWGFLVALLIIIL